MNKLSALWQGAGYQDQLLQSYRKIHLMLQSVLIATGTALAVTVISFGDERRAAPTYVLLIVFSIMGVYLLSRMSKLLRARAADVDYYHNQIIEAERLLPKEEQVLTAFKVYQKFSRDESNKTEFFQKFQLTEEIRAQLTEKGKGHTREFLDGYLLTGFYLTWTCLHLIVIFNWIFRLL